MDFDYTKYASNVADAIEATRAGDTDKVATIIHEATAPITGAIATEFVRRGYKKLFGRSRVANQATDTEAEAEATSSEEPLSMTRNVGRLGNTDVFDSIGLDEDPVMPVIERPSLLSRVGSAIRQRLTSSAEPSSELSYAPSSEPSLYDAPSDATIESVFSVPEAAPASTSNVIGDLLRTPNIRSYESMMERRNVARQRNTLQEEAEPSSSDATAAEAASSDATEATSSVEAGATAAAEGEGDSALLASLGFDETPVGLLVTGGIALADLFANVFGHNTSIPVTASTQFGISR